MPFTGFSSSAPLRDLGDTLLTLQSTDEIVCLLADVCTEPQLQMIAERWTIAKYIHMGFSYRTIARKTGASSATIARVAGKMQWGTGILKRACRQREVSKSRDPYVPLLLEFR